MRRVLILLFSMILPFTGCKKQGSGISSHIQFSIGGDLSYVNQILDMGGVYRDSGKPADPYLIFSSYGANTIRFRLFHNPEWTAGVYEPPLDHFYNDIEDTRRGILAAKANGMAVCLDFHYSDTWADPQKQIKPSAWDNLTPEVLADSLYNYTYQTLRKLDASGAMPEYVQVGNEINPGFLLPTGDRWKNTTVFAGLLNSAIRGVRDASVQSATKPKIILHVAQPENAIRWFQGLDSYGITDYDIVGLSYYYIWSTVKIDLLSDYIEAVRKNTGRDVMIVETAYPWTTLNGDSYGNII
ncbi:MAG: arabinogalactan endo-1,4-beta-galactosidase, partial [Bacteroidetes bacterium]|nr:arabinogalactan endo-1,4-beta-galactosidase [Bacteroidota bacterium]